MNRRCPRLKVDFWDINEMANKIVAVLRHPPPASTMRQHGSFEIRRMSSTLRLDSTELIEVRPEGSWTDAARACVNVYGQAIGAMSNGGR